MDWISQLFAEYGYAVLFFGLFTESIALPFPGELAMAYAGHIAYLGHMNLGIGMLYSFLGATIGTIITYVLGWKLGTPFFENYGKYMFLGPERMEKLSQWFGKYGTKLLLVSYYIPGLRHFTGYMSGMLGVRFRTFFVYNTTGAVLWVITYSMIGNLLGERWEQLIHLISTYSVRTAIFAVIGIALVITIRKYKKSIFRGIRSLGHVSYRFIASCSPRLKLLTAITSTLFLLLLYVWMSGLYH